jgi:uncharacterized membrane protein YdjX (TVP38/TMEM64 family)
LDENLARKHSYIRHGTSRAKYLYSHSVLLAYIVAALSWVVRAAQMELDQPNTAPAVWAALSSALLIVGIQSLALPPYMALAVTSGVIYARLRRA